MLKCTHVTAPQIQRTHSSALPLCQVPPRILLGGGRSGVSHPKGKAPASPCSSDWGSREAEGPGLGLLTREGGGSVGVGERNGGEPV